MSVARERKGHIRQSIMAKSDSYVRRLKSAALTVFGAAVLTYNVYESGASLSRDFDRMESLYLATQLMTARMPERASIRRVGAESLSSWLAPQDLNPPPPTTGPLGDIVRLIAAVNPEIAGVLMIPNGEVVDFVRLDSGPAALDDALPDGMPSSPRQRCEDGTRASCHRFVVRLGGNRPEHRLVIGYLPAERGEEDETRHRWHVFDPPTGNFIDQAGAESAILELAGPWVGVRNGAGQAYDATRNQIAQRTVRIPIVGIDVPAARAAVYLSLFAVAMAVLLLHSVLTIAALPVRSIEEPWIVVQTPDPARPGSRRLMGWIGMVGSLVIHAMLWAPAAIVALSMAMTASVRARIALSVALALVLGAAVAGSAYFMAVAREAKASDN